MKMQFLGLLVKPTAVVHFQVGFGDKSFGLPIEAVSVGLNDRNFCKRRPVYLDSENAV
jgi:hypothetical protein